MLDSDLFTWLKIFHFLPLIKYLYHLMLFMEKSLLACKKDNSKVLKLYSIKLLSKQNETIFAFVYPLHDSSV